jgi:membrane protein DedA with SNARE-associated domain
MVRLLIESSLGYPGLWLVCAGSGIVFPVPEDVPLMVAGSQIAAGSWEWAATLAVAWVGVGMRDVTAWAIGRYLLGRLLEGRLSFLIGKRRLARAQRLVARHGVAAVLMGRFMVGFRSPMFMAAGASGVPLRSFVAVDGLGLILAIPLTVGLGYAFGAPIAEIAGMLIQRASSVVMLAVAVGGVWVIWRVVSGAASREATRVEEDPEAGSPG